MAPALTEATGQALKLPYAPTSKDDDDDCSPATLKHCDHSDELTNSAYLVQDLGYAQKGPVAPRHVSSGLVVNGKSEIGLQEQLPGRPCTMNGKTESKCYNVDSRVVTAGKRTMGLIKTGLMMNADVMARKADVQPPPLDADPLQETPVQPQRATVNLLEAAQVRQRFQANLQRRTERMLRRIYKLQATHFAQHLSLQLIDFVSYQRKALGLPITNARAVLHSSSSSSSSSNNGVKSDILQREDAKNLSTAALVNLVRELESGGIAGEGSKSRRQQRVNVQRYGARIPAEGGLTKGDLCAEIEWTSGNLLTNLGHLESEIDSDATASSSGGESCDEKDADTDDKRPRAVYFRKKASWRWAMDRAAVVSRWTWLQAQVSDLEYQIKQTSEIYRKIRTMKEPLLDERANTACATSSAQMNGFVGGPTGRSGQEVVSCLPEESCSRTCPFLRPLKRRKLLRTLDLPQLNRKAAKLSSVQCGCSPPSRICNTCCGRVNSFQTVDVEKMSFTERVGLLDPCFHPVLSFPQDTPLAVHFEALLRNGDPGKGIAKSRSATAVKKKGRAPLNISEHARKQCRKLKKNAAATLTAKLRKKLSKDKRVPGRRRRRDAGIPRIKKATHSGLPTADQLRQRSISESSGLSSKPESPVPSPGFVENSSSQASGNSSWGSADLGNHPKKGSMLHEMMRRRRGESAFDINNIVIPYSMAAATRVERLQYKEIITPKWRLVEDVLPETDGSTSQLATNDQEDISDEMCTRRHDKCEHDEKKRFMGYLNRQHATARRTRSMRSDSRADSSGANTPDPMSPHNVEPHESPITTPPSTPAPEDVSQLSSRRRTTSLSKRDRMLDDLRIPTPDFTIEDVPVLPWDSRTFPLPDQDYEQMLEETAAYEDSLVGPPRDILGGMETDWNECPELPVLEAESVPLVSLEDADWNPAVSSAGAAKSPTRHSIVLKLAKR